MNLRNRSTVVCVLLLSLGASAGYAKDALVELNGVKLSVEEFQALADEVKDGMPGYSFSDEDKGKLLDTWIKEEMLAQEAIKQNLDKGAAAKYRLQEAKRQALARFTLESKVLNQVKLSIQEVQEFYDANKREFKTSERVRARHILVETEELAKTVYAELKSGGDFVKLAKKYSKDDGNKDKGGDLGFFSRGDLGKVPELEKLIFSLKKGARGGPLKTALGYHIVQVEEIRSAGTKKLDEVEDVIGREILIRKRQEVMEEYVRELKAKAKLVERREYLQDVKLH
jgi:peptidyl-prolyl cis-trans isomerase C